MAKRKTSKATKAKATRKRAPGSKPKKKSSAKPKSKPQPRKRAAVQREKQEKNAKRKRPERATRAKPAPASRGARKKPTKAQRERARAKLAAEAKRLRTNELKRRRRKRDRAEKNAHERDYFVTILESLADRSAYPLDVAITEPEPGARTPWLVVGKYEPGREIGYAELHKIMKRWERDLFLEAKIHPQRRCQIRIVYSDPKAKRGEADSIVSSIGPWEGVTSDMAAETDPQDEDSLASRYKETTVTAFYVYFSSEIY